MTIGYGGRAGTPDRTFSLEVNFGAREGLVGTVAVQVDRARGGWELEGKGGVPVHAL